MGLFYFCCVLDNLEYIRVVVVRLLVNIFIMVVVFELMCKGNDFVKLRDNLDYVVNFLYMLNEKEFDLLVVKVFDVCLIFYVEYIINVFIFLVMVIVFILIDFYGVIVLVVGIFAGLLYGGVNEDVIDMLFEIGLVENVRLYLEKYFGVKGKIVGFGY